MAIRESLLNTITSVASSDFVRLVTSAGESSKATVANLFKSFESGLGAKSSLTTSDYIRVVGSDNACYKQAVTSLANTVGAYNATPILLTDCDDATDPSKIYYANGNTANRPAAAWWFIKCDAKSGNMIFQTAYYMNATDILVYNRSRNTSGTWGSWVKVPTRAEVDALNNFFTKVINVTTSTTFTLPNNYRGTMYIHDSGSATCGEYMVAATAAGNVTYKAISAANNITLSDATNKLTVTPTSGSRVVLFINAQGVATV